MIGTRKESKASLGKTARGELIGQGITALLCVALWIVCVIAIYRLGADFEADQRMWSVVDEVNGGVVGVAVGAGGQVLVNEVNDMGVSLLVVVPAESVSEMSAFLSDRSEEVGSEVSAWENSETAVVHVKVELNDSQAAALRKWSGGLPSARHMAAIVTGWLMSGLVIALVCVLAAAFVHERRTARGTA